jgi:hypothetical protein
MERGVLLSLSRPSAPIRPRLPADETLFHGRGGLLVGVTKNQRNNKGMSYTLDKAAIRRQLVIANEYNEDACLP